MATAPTPLHVEQESDMSTARQVSISASDAAAEQSTVNPLLVVMLVALAVYPFVVGYLPEPVRQYLGALFR
jgi:hypothetical protein